MPRRPLREDTMELIAKKPILLGKNVISDGDIFETHDQHGKELIDKGYAALKGATAAVPPAGEGDGDGEGEGDLKPGEKFVAGKAADVIASIEGTDRELLAAALEAEKAKGDKQRKGVVEALTAAVEA